MGWLCFVLEGCRLHCLPARRTRFYCGNSALRTKPQCRHFGWYDVLVAKAGKGAVRIAMARAQGCRAFLLVTLILLHRAFGGKFLETVAWAASGSRYSLRATVQKNRTRRRLGNGACGFGFDSTRPERKFTHTLFHVGLQPASPPLSAARCVTNRSSKAS